MKKDSRVSSEKIYTVSEITHLIKLELEHVFPFLWIEGEISNFHHHQSGHLYFTLKDENSQIRCVMFRSEANNIPFELKDGLQIICGGKINVYVPRGEYQLLVEKVEPKGKGALQLAFEQLKEKLKKEGLFDPAHKKRLPLLPKKVGVVTSPRGAAIVDIVRTLGRRFSHLHIIIYPVKVQGEGASVEIAEGIEYLGNIPDIDVIIVGRGGGSIEDLWAFNEENVARAIYDCSIPVISAVGHEIDFTIADFVADIRASTPSAAAEIVVEKEQSFLDRIENLERRMINQGKYLLQEKQHDVFRLIHHHAFQNFNIYLLNLEQKLDELEIAARNTINSMIQKIGQSKSSAVLLEEKMSNAMNGILQDLNGKWEKLSVGLNNLSPLNILKKGYTLCWKDRGERLMRRIEEVTEKDEVTVSFYKGEFTCSVKKIDGSKSIESHYIKEG